MDIQEILLELIWNLVIVINKDIGADQILCKILRKFLRNTIFYLTIVCNITFYLKYFELISIIFEFTFTESRSWKL